MARTNQQLINYHTGSKTAMPTTGAVQFGEIVVRHNSENPQILIKVSEGTKGEEGYKEYFVPFIASGAVYSAITAAVAAAKGLVDADITDVRNYVDAVSGTVTNFYATSADTVAAIEAAKNSAIETASGYTDTQITALSGSVVEAIEGVTGGDLSQLKQRVSALETFSGVVESSYATSADTVAAIDAAAEDVKEELIGESTDEATANTINGAKAYADSKVKELSGNVVTYVDGEVSDLSQSINDVDGRVDSLSGTVSALSADMKTYIDNELSTVYTYQGSVADVAALEAIENPEVGDVYNVVAANGAPGDADYTPAGTNYAWNGSAWDALGGTVDLSNYATTGALESAVTRITALESQNTEESNNIDALSGAIETLSGQVVNNYSTTEQVDAKIGAASAAAVTSAYTASTGYTDEQIAALSAASSSYTDTQISNVTSLINEVKGDYALSSVTHNEIEEAKTTIIGSDVATSADPQTITGLKLYSDEKDRQLSGSVIDMINSLSGAMGTDVAGVQGQVSALEQRVNANETKLESASTWNNAIQGAEFGTVQSTDNHYDGGEGSGATVDSNAKIKYTEGGNIVLDLSGLIIDCGDFE